MTDIEFKQLYAHHYKTLFQQACRLAKNRQDAMDLLQETSCKAYANREKFIPNSNFRAWMNAILRTVFIDEYRRKVKQANKLWMDTHLISTLTVRHKVHNCAESQMMYGELNGLVQNIHKMYHKPFLLFSEGFSYKEIADQLGLPMGTVKSRIFYARQQLAEKVNTYYN